MIEKNIELIAKNEKYINYCKKITSYDAVLWKDLHQEFLIYYLKNETKINQMPSDEADLYLYGVVYRIWNDPKRGRNTYKLEKSPFYSITDNVKNLSGYIEHKKITQQTKEEKELKLQLVQELNKLLSSDNEKTRKGAEYLRLFVEGKNRLQISKELGVNYKIVHQQIESTVNRIKATVTGKNYMTKTEIQITLRSEGVKAAYSGKDKTFYVDKLPATGIIKEVEQAGFKIETNKK